VDVTSTQAQAKKLAPPVRQGETQAEPARAKSPSTLALLTADGVDRLGNQQAEIHAIAAVQLAVCSLASD
jgi:hypothetical protein